MLVERFGSVANIELIIAIAIGLVLGHLTKEYKISLAFFYGVLLHSVINSLDDFLSSGSVKNGLVGLLYLEILDASFSFDGVIGAFALSSKIYIIMIGLGIGALYVRSLTIYFVEKKTLSKFIYLEHGAHYAIGILAIIMFVKIFFEVNEAFTGTVGITLIVIAFIHSLRENKKEL